MIIDALTLFLILAALVAIAGALALYGAALILIALWMMLRDWYPRKINIQPENCEWQTPTS